MRLASVKDYEMRPSTIQWIILKLLILLTMQLIIESKNTLFNVSFIINLKMCLSFLEYPLYNEHAIEGKAFQLKDYTAYCLIYIILNILISLP